MQTIPQLGKKVDFRITDEEYEVLRICALEKGMTVSRFLRAIVTACVAPTLLTTTPELRQSMLKALIQRKEQEQLK